jgi:glycerol dehydrogenase-like iron-containing ADH family enzyme
MKTLLEPKKIENFYRNKIKNFEFIFERQKISTFFGKNILKKELKKILGKNKPKFIIEDLDSIRSLKEELAEEFGSDEDSNYLICLGGAIAIGKGKIIRNEDSASIMISIPTSCSNDAFFTNRYKKEDKYHKETSEALIGLMPDYLIVDSEMITLLVTEDIVYAGWGEFLAMITSYYDWRENNQNKINVQEIAFLDILTKKMFEDACIFFKKEKKIKKHIDLLMRFLFMKCLYMIIYNDNTIGASSDHMISYAMQELGYCKELRHGYKVLFGAVISSICYELLLNKKLIKYIPPEIIHHLFKKEDIKEILNAQDLKKILSKSLSTRSRTTILNKLPQDQIFYEKLEKNLKCLET